MNPSWRRWLFVSPHADDSEFGCGGLLAQLARQPGVLVEVLVLTSREETTGERVELTREYQREALNALGLERATISLARLLSRRLPDLHEEVRQALARVQRDFQPDVVFTTPHGDRMQDHHAVALEVARVFRGTTVLEYEVISSSISFAPSAYWEVSEADLERKIRAIHCHKGQAHKPYFAPDVIRALARVRGSHSSRFTYAEAFRPQIILWPALEASAAGVSSDAETQLAYNESRNDLTSRIEAHRHRSGSNVEDFILELARPTAGEVVVDLCCGTGKQVLAMAPCVGATGRVIGLDLQPALLEAGREAARELPQVEFREHDANEPLPLETGSVDLLTCCYGIYYIENLQALIAEIDRVLAPAGRVFVIGPARDNNHELRRLHAELTERPEPGAISEYRDRIESSVKPQLEARMRVDVHEFTNQLRFTDADDFVRYYRSTPLLAKSALTPTERDQVVERARQVVAQHIESSGAFTIRKVALALVGQKQ